MTLNTDSRSQLRMLDVAIYPISGISVYYHLLWIHRFAPDRFPLRREVDDLSAARRVSFYLGRDLMQRQIAFPASLPSCYNTFQR